MKFASKFAGVTFLLWVLLGCSATEEAHQIPSQTWEGVVFVVEVEPNPVRQGMHEFKILATEPRGKPVHGFIISLRAGEHLAWRQTIQDGLSGVYRRAVNVSAAEAPELQVKIRRKRTDEEVVLNFLLRAPVVLTK